MMSQRTQNLILTVLLLSLAAWIARGGSEEALKQAGLIAGSVLLLWRHSGRQRPEDGGSLADALPPPGGPAVPLFCLAFLILGACEVVFGVGKIEHQAARPVEALATATDALVFTPKSAYSCPSGKACFWASSSDNQLYAVDAAGVVLKAQAARSFRTSTNCAGLSSPLAGDVCYDTTVPAPRWYNGSAWASLPSDALVVHLAGSETITGAKTFSAAQTFNGNVTLGDAAADTVTVKGALRVENAANTFYASISHTATANRAVTLPDAAGAIVLDSATQTLTNKTIGVSQLSGQVAKANGGTGEDNSTGGTANTFWARPNGSTGAASYRAIVAADIPGSSLTSVYAAQWLAHASGGLTAGGTKYLQTSDSAGEAASQKEIYLAALPSASAQVLAFGCVLKTAPGSGESVVFTVQKSTDQGASFSDTTATCTISGTSKTCADTTNHPTTAQFDLLAVKIVNSNNGGFAAADAHCSAHMAK